MDIITGVTIVTSVAVSAGAIFGIVKAFKEPNSKIMESLKNMEEKLDQAEEKFNKRVNIIDNRLTKNETKVETLTDLKNDLNKVDDKLEKLSNILIEYISKNS